MPPAKHGCTHFLRLRYRLATMTTRNTTINREMPPVSTENISKSRQFCNTHTYTPPNDHQVFEMQLQARVKEQQTLHGHMWMLKLSSNVHTVSMAGDSSLLRHYAASLRVTGTDLLKDHNALITKVSADQEFLCNVRNRSPNNAESHYRTLQSSSV